MWFFNKKKQDKLAQAMHPNDNQNYWSIVRKQFVRNRMAVWSLRFFYFIVAIALFADFLANDKPLYCSVTIINKVDAEGNKRSYNKTVFPIIHSYFVGLGIAKWDEAFLMNEWASPDEKKFKYNYVIFPPITYLPEKTDISNTTVGPFDKQHIRKNKRRHYLGTDVMGRDVASGMIHGTRIAMLVGIIAMSIATFIGIVLGAIAGYFADDKLKLSIGSIVLHSISVIAFIFIVFIARGFEMSDNISKGFFIFEVFLNTGILMLCLLVAQLLSKITKFVPGLNMPVSVPVDIIVMRLIEIVTSIPLLILILAVLAIIETHSIFYVMALIGAVSWTGIAKFVRAELLRVRSLEYIEAAQAFGYSEYRIILRHAIPNALAPVLIAIAFGIASAILTEAFLSFIGVGVPPDQITWGSLLKASGIAGIKAWWLALFPGIAIFVSVTIFNLLGEGLTDALDPRLKQ